jgi:hypothetical protein
LGSGVEAHEKYPETFWIPSDEMKDEVEPGHLVKLIFRHRKGGERMWVEVTQVQGGRLVGTLANSPAVMPKLDAGDEIEFEREHIIGIGEPHPPGCNCGAEPAEPEPVCPCCFDTRNEPE